MTEQQEALAAIKEWLGQKKQPYFLLEGAAGTGKTYLTKQISLQNPKEVFLFTAPTNKATQQLEVALGKEIVCKTVHRALGLILSYTEVRQLEFGSKALKALDNVTC
jgi:excinuclease UvrABC helicase subunit UvrB